MSYFAQINSENIVVRVIVAEQDFIDSGAVGDPANWIETDHNTRGGIHYDIETRQPSADQSKALRMNAAVFGSSYNAQRDVFISPKPAAVEAGDFVLDEQTCLWKFVRKAPII
jgi:hypothetical protein